MKYSPLHKSLIIDQQSIQYLADSILYSMKKYRQITNTPLGKRDHDGPLTDMDHAERGIIEGLKGFGIDLGIEWGHQLDLSDINT